MCILILSFFNIFSILNYFVLFLSLRMTVLTNSCWSRTQSILYKFSPSQVTGPAGCPVKGPMYISRLKTSVVSFNSFQDLFHRPSCTKVSVERQEGLWVDPLNL